jgi:hypothetical protein
MRNALLVLALLAAPASAWDRIDGQRSGIKTFHVEAVQDEAAWQALWARHNPNEPVPAVDFSKEQVAAVFLGMRTQGGYSVGIELMNDPLESSRLVVFYQAVAPSRRAFNSTVVSYPFAFVKTRRASAVSFEADSRVGTPVVREGRPANPADERRVSVPVLLEPRPANPVDERRVRIQLDALQNPSFDGAR